LHCSTGVVNAPLIADVAEFCSFGWVHPHYSCHRGIDFNRNTVAKKLALSTTHEPLASFMRHY